MVGGPLLGGPALRGYRTDRVSGRFPLEVGSEPARSVGEASRLDGERLGPAHPEVIESVTRLIAEDATGLLQIPNAPRTFPDDCDGCIGGQRDRQSEGKCLRKIG